MKILTRSPLATAVIALGMGFAQTSQAVVIDDFSSGSLSNYTSTVILDNNGGASNVSMWEVDTQLLQLNTSTYDGIEQYAFIYGGLSLSVGQELQMTYFHSTASQDIGLYVGGTTPTFNVRQDYVNVYARANGQIFSRGFDGTMEFNLEGGATPATDTLFIARTADNTYETGYYEGSNRVIISTRTPTTPNEADVVGFYADVRAVGILGYVDTLSVVAIPEPATLAMLLGGLGMLAIFRRRA